MQLIESGLPVLIETGSEEWPYAVRGTYFVVELDDCKYVVTARHVVDGNSATSVFFRYRGESRFSLPLDQEISAKGYVGPESPEYMDVILYRVAENEADKPFKVARLDISTQPWLTLKEDDLLIFRGFPSELQAVDADGLKEQGVVLNARYIGPTHNPGCHEIRLFPTELFATHDGFSGCPVFLANQGSTRLVGLLVKASSFQNRAVLVDGSVICKLIGG